MRAMGATFYRGYARWVIDPTRVLDFTDHRRDLADNHYIYAVVSRRARGLSIGVNLNPDKVCNFDCPYCQVDRTTPGGSAVIDLPRLRDELARLFALIAAGTLWSVAPFDTTAPALRRVVDIAFAGDGEPTTPAIFPEVAAAVHAMRDAASLHVPLRLLTNGTMLHRGKVKAALSHFDEVWCKLDAGTADYFRVVDGTGFPFSRLLANLLETARVRPIVIQAMFLELDGVGPAPAEIDAWAGRLAHIASGGGKIDRVQVYTVARKPASTRVRALPDVALEGIAARVRTLGIPVEVYGSG